MKWVTVTYVVVVGISVVTFLLSAWSIVEPLRKKRPSTWLKNLASSTGATLILAFLGSIYVIATETRDANAAYEGEVLDSLRFETNLSRLDSITLRLSDLSKFEKVQFEVNQVHFDSSTRRLAQLGDSLSVASTSLSASVRKSELSAKYLEALHEPIAQLRLRFASKLAIPSYFPTYVKSQLELHVKGTGSTDPWVLPLPSKRASHMDSVLHSYTALSDWETTAQIGEVTMRFEHSSGQRFDYVLEWGDPALYRASVYAYYNDTLYVAYDCPLVLNNSQGFDTKTLSFRNLHGTTLSFCVWGQASNGLIPGLTQIEGRNGTLYLGDNELTNVKEGCWTTTRPLKTKSNWYRYSSEPPSP